jgi:hypothetical protein
MSSLKVPVPASKTSNLLAIRLTATDPAAYLKSKPGGTEAQGFGRLFASRTSGWRAGLRLRVLTRGERQQLGVGPPRLLELRDHQLVAEVQLLPLEQVRVAVVPEAAVEVGSERADRPLDLVARHIREH